MADMVLKGVLLGFALAMDAFSVSVVNGLNESGMSGRKTIYIPFTFAIFQFIMPLAGWFFVSRMTKAFQGFKPFIPWIAFIILLYVGGKMLFDSIMRLKNGEVEEEYILGFVSLMLQGIATSIDALSVGFTISDYRLDEAVLISFIIAVVTFILCLIGIIFGKKIGGRISNGAGILGGLILISIGVKSIVTVLMPLI